MPPEILYYITVAAKPTELVETRRGMMPYRDWCESEIARIHRKNPEWPLAVVENGATGEIALAHLRVTPL